MPNYQYPNIAGVIIAGGKGKRMKSNTPKPFILLNNKPLIWYSFRLLDKLGIKEQIVSIPAKNNKYFIKSISEIKPNILCVPDNVSKRGNAAGLASVIPILPSKIKHILVLHPDGSCFITINTILPALEKHIKDNLIASFNIKEKDMPKAQKAKTNQEFEPTTASTFIFKKDWVNKALQRLRVDSETKEFRIEYLFERATKEPGRKIALFPIRANERININTPEDLKKAERMVKRKQND